MAELYRNWPKIRRHSKAGFALDIELKMMEETFAKTLTDFQMMDC